MLTLTGDRLAQREIDSLSSTAPHNAFTMAPAVASPGTMTTSAHTGYYTTAADNKLIVTYTVNVANIPTDVYEGTDYGIDFITKSVIT